MLNPVLQAIAADATRSLPQGMDTLSPTGFISINAPFQLLSFHKLFVIEDSFLCASPNASDTYVIHCSLRSHKH